MDLPKYIAEQIAAAIAQLDPNGNLPDSRGASYGALPLLADMGGCWFVRPEGVFLEVVWDKNEDCPKELDNPPIAALVVGAERYPWLRELLPLRPSSAIDCNTCRGRGRILVAGVQGEFLCSKCQCLGWIVQESSTKLV